MANDRKALQREAVRIRALIERGGLSPEAHGRALADLAVVNELLRAIREGGEGRG